MGCVLDSILTAAQMIRLTIRATDDSVPAVLMKLMEERIGAGASPPQERQAPSRSDIDGAFANVMVS
jgi:AP-2 complex subunit alpha